MDNKIKKISLFSVDEIFLFFSLVSISVVILFFGNIFSFFWDDAIKMFLGLIFFVFFGGLLWKSPIIFLTCIIPFRVILDYFGETILFQIGESSFNYSRVFGIGIFILCGIFFALNRQFIKFTRIFWPFWILFFWGMISYFYSIEPYSTVKELLRIFYIFALATIAYGLSLNTENIKKLITGVIFSAVIPLIFGIEQFFSGNGYVGEYDSLNRVYGTFGHPNVFGTYLFIIIAVIFIYIRFYAKNLLETTLLWCIGICSFLIMLATYSRVSWVMFLVFFLISSLLFYRKLFLAIITGSIFLFLLFPSIQSRINDIFIPSSDSSILWRFQIWQDAISQVFLSKKELFGFGLDTFSSVISSLHTRQFGSANAHNDFVKFFVEGGIVGFSCYIFFMGWFLFDFLRKYLEKSRDKNQRELFLVFGILFFCIFLASFSDMIFWNTPLNLVFWILAGAFLGMYSEKNNLKYLN